MPNWISTDDLLERWNALEFEFFRYLKHGLVPYLRRDGTLLPCPPEHHSWHIVSNRLKTAKGNLKMLRQSGINRVKILYMRRGDDPEKIIRMLGREKSMLPRRLEIIENDQDDELHVSWRHFIRPRSESQMQRILSLLMKEAVFKEAEVKRFERNFKFGSRDSLRKPALPRKVRELVKKARPEIETIYEAIKRGVGFPGYEAGLEEKWREAALKEFHGNSKKFKIIKEEYLEKKDLYALSLGKEKRDFVGRILKNIVYENNHGSLSARRLYKEYM